MKIIEIKEGFKNYLMGIYPNPKTWRAFYSDTFYWENHDLGVSLWSLLKDDSTIDLARSVLKEHFEKIGRKSPGSDASVYTGGVKHLKKFIDIKYGGIDQLLSECGEIVYDQAVSTTRKYVPKTQTQRKTRKDIPRPNSSEVIKYLKRWDELENYTVQEKAIKRLFSETYPLNNRIDEVLIKVAALNTYYATNVMYPYEMAKRIISTKDFDVRLKDQDATLVNEIARKLHCPNGKCPKHYSFATKYCSHHNPLGFAIYDVYVAKVLLHFQKVDGFAIFSDDDLKDYPKFINIMNQFRKHYNIDQHNLKDIDRYLWQLGKEYFGRNNKQANIK